MLDLRSKEDAACVPEGVSRTRRTSLQLLVKAAAMASACAPSPIQHSPATRNHCCWSSNSEEIAAALGAAALPANAQLRLRGRGGVGVYGEHITPAVNTNPASNLEHTSAADYAASDSVTGAASPQRNGRGSFADAPARLPSTPSAQGNPDGADVAPLGMAAGSKPAASSSTYRPRRLVGAEPQRALHPSAETPCFWLVVSQAASNHNRNRVVVCVRWKIVPAVTEA